MEDAAAHDWLPQGWRVEVRVRTNGKRDKFYFPPSGQGRFCSKVEVARYLKNTQPKPGDKKQGNDCQSTKKVEKAIPEGLPPGWTKEIRVTKKGHNIRKDAFYTDPVSGYVFRSMKDALRYLKSGELGKMAFKPKDKVSSDMELEDDKASSSGAAKKQKLAPDGTSSLNTGDHSSKFSEVATDEQTFHSGSRGECAAASEHTSGVHMEPSRSELLQDHASVKTEGKTDSAESLLDVAPAVRVMEVQPELSSSELLEEKGSDQTEGKGDSFKSAFAVAPSVGVLGKQPSETEEIKGEIKSLEQSKSKKKKKINLPLRASKRLAGVPLDPMQELKTNRAHRAAVKQSDDRVASTHEQSSPDLLDTEMEAKNVTKMALESSKGKRPIRIVEHVGKADTKSVDDEKPESSFVSPRRELPNPGQDNKVGTERNVDEKPDPILDPSLGVLWQDPCIAFAIRTLTGVSFDDSDGIKVSEVSYNSEFKDLDSFKEHSRKEDVSGRVDKNQACTMVVPLGNLDIPEEHSVDAERSEKADEKSGSSLNFPFADAWVDPCIEFAIKTLTGAIPLNGNVVIQDYPPPQGARKQ